jgi:hypothetical protein
MNRSFRNVANVNGNPVDLQKVIDNLKVELQEIKDIAEANYNGAEELGRVLAITQEKLAEAEIANGKLQEELKVQSQILAGKETKVEEKPLNKKKAKDEQVSVEVQSE